MTARIYTLPVRDRHVAGERPDWANGERQRIADAAYKLGVKDATRPAFERGFIAAMAVYAIGSALLVLAFAALGLHL